jgi:hypothetical protein
MRKTEIEREVRLKELEIREKELSQGANRVHSSDKLKSKLPKFKKIVGWPIHNKTKHQ